MVPTQKESASAFALLFEAKKVTPEQLQSLEHPDIPLEGKENIGKISKAGLQFYFLYLTRKQIEKSYKGAEPAKYGALWEEIAKLELTIYNFLKEDAPASINYPLKALHIDRDGNVFALTGPWKKEEVPGSGSRDIDELIERHERHRRM